MRKNRKLALLFSMLGLVVATLTLSLELGASPANITSIYDGTALIAAAHLGHIEVVKVLIDRRLMPCHPTCPWPPKNFLSFGHVNGKARGAKQIGQPSC